MVRFLLHPATAILLMFFALSQQVQAVTFPTDCNLVNENRIIPGKECDALLDLYNSANGEGWSNNTGWNQDNNPCGWYGVTCGTNPDSSGFVQVLKLSSNNLNGPLPESFGAGGSFANLTSLDLWNNSLTGPLPANFANLTSLAVLSLSSNQLTGGIPSWIVTLSNLIEIDLSANPIGGDIPADIQNLTNLQNLYLIDSQLTGRIPTEIGNMTTLVDLELNDNQLTGSIPSSIGNLTNLQWLVLENNQLCGEIPGSLINLVNLRNVSPGPAGLYLQNNYLYTNDPDLDAFLVIKGGDWQSSQGELCPSNPFWNLVLPSILNNQQ